MTTNASKTTGRVLIVDDDPDTRDAIVQALDFSGFDVFGVRSGKIALDVLPNSNVEVVIADWAMPGMNGIELIEKVHLAHPHVRCALLTGLKAPLGDELERLGTAEVAGKPIDLPHLVDLVNRAMERSR